MVQRAWRKQLIDTDWLCGISPAAVITMPVRASGSSGSAAASSRLRELKAALTEPIPDLTTLKSLLQDVQETLRGDSELVGKHLPSIQLVLLDKILPHWHEAIRDDASVDDLFRSLFVPPAVEGKGKARMSRGQDRIALASYSTLTRHLSTLSSSPSKLDDGLLSYICSLLAALTSTGIREIYDACFFDTPDSDAKANLAWEEAWKSMLSIPSRVDNIVGRFREETGSFLKVPPALGRVKFMDGVARDIQLLVQDLSSPDCSSRDTFVARLRPLLVKLQTLGFFRASPRSARAGAAINITDPSFFSTTFPDLLDHPWDDHGKQGSLWPELLFELPRETSSAIIWSFLEHLSSRSGQAISPAINLDDIPRPSPSARVVAGADFLNRFLGTAKFCYETEPDVWQVVLDWALARSPSREFSANALGRFDVDGVELRSRILVAWAGQGKPLESLFEAVIAVWTDEKHVKYASFGRHVYVTHLVALLIARLGAFQPLLHRLAFESSFLTSIQSYLTHSDPSVRRLGMLVAELLSEYTIPENAQGRGRYAEKSADEITKELEGMLDELDVDDEKRAPPRPAAPPTLQRLDFGKQMWDGTGQGKEECRYLRACAHLKDEGTSPTEVDRQMGWTQEAPASPIVPPEPVIEKPRRSRPSRTKPLTSAKIQVLNPDSEDDLVGYASDRSIRSSRSPSPTPSYLEEIAKDPMLNMSGRDKVERPVYILQLIKLLKARQEPDKLEVAFKWGEPLIRRKRGFGTELAENAIELATVLLALSDPYDIANFEERRQGMLIALAACVPKLVAPYLTQQYFDGQYSLMQRSAILTALAMSARETAGLPTIQPAEQARIDFPSKVLPEHLHKQYAIESDVVGSRLLDAASSEAASDVLTKAKGSAPREVTRRQQFKVKVRPRKLIQEVDDRLSSDDEEQLPPALPPPINHFRDICAEYYVLPLLNRFWDFFQDEITRDARSGGGGIGGAGMILSPLAMGRFLHTLTVLLHAARLSPTFFRILAPQSLELAVTIGARLTSTELESEVVTAALELALVCLDGCKEQDGGRSLAQDSPELLMGASEWAGKIFEAEDKGEKTSVHSAGGREAKEGRAAAGVVVIASEILQKQLGYGL